MSNRWSVVSTVATIGVAAVALGLPVAVATELPVRRAVTPTSNAGPFNPPSADCLEWTDGCRTCERKPGAEATCSNVGIACVPRAPVCSRR